MSLLGSGDVSPQDQLATSQNVSVIPNSSQDSTVDRTAHTNLRADLDFYAARLQETVLRERKSFDDLEAIWKQQKKVLQEEVAYWRRLANQRLGRAGESTRDEQAESDKQLVKSLRLELAQCKQTIAAATANSGSGEEDRLRARIAELQSENTNTRNGAAKAMAKLEHKLQTEKEEHAKTRDRLAQLVQKRAKDRETIKNWAEQLTLRDARVEALEARLAGLSDANQARTSKDRSPVRIKTENEIVPIFEILNDVGQMGKVIEKDIADGPSPRDADGNADKENKVRVLPSAEPINVEASVDEPLSPQRMPLHDGSQTLNRLLVEPPVPVPNLNLKSAHATGKRARSVSPQKSLVSSTLARCTDPQVRVRLQHSSRTAESSPLARLGGPRTAESSPLARMGRGPGRGPLISDEVARENKGRDRYSTSMRKQPAERGWSLDDFVINPDYNHDLNYAYHDVLRGAERECVHGKECARCKEFYEALGPVTPLPTGPKWNDNSPTPVKAGKVSSATGEDAVRKMIAQTSRHRHAWDRPPSPVGFWRSEFPTTQEEQQDREEEQRRYREKVDERLHEALRGGKYIFKDKAFRAAARQD